jgi:type IV pilus assembly protein PilQ
MMRRALAVLMLLAGLFAAGCAGKTPGKVQQEIGMVVVKSISISDYRVEVQMSSEFSSSYSIEKMDDPYRAAVILPEVALGDMPGLIPSEKPGLSELRLTMMQTPVLITRIEFVLDEPRDLIPEKHGKMLVVRFRESGSAVEEQKDKPLPVATTVTEEGEEIIELLPATEISALELVSKEMETRLVVYGDGSMEPEIFTLPGRIVIDVPKVAMKAPVPSEIYPPIKDIRIGSYGDKVRLVLDMKHDGDFMAVTEDNKIVVSMPVMEQKAKAFGAGISVEEIMAGGPSADALEAEAPEEAVEAPEDVAAGPEEVAELPEEGLEATPEGMAKPGFAGYVGDPDTEYKRKYTGKTISLDFQDADVVPIFRFLAEIGGYNVVIHPSVAGKVTLKLTDVPWDHALEIILELTSNGKHLEGNILRIAPGDVFLKQKEAEARLKASEKKAADLQQVAVQLKHISAKEMSERLAEAKTIQSKEVGGQGIDRSTIRIDERTNTIIISDTPDGIKRIMEVEIPYWDTSDHGTMQVLIEAKIVTVSTQYTKNLGVRWGGSATNDNFSFISDNMTFDFSVNTPYSLAGPRATATGGVLSVGYAETVNLNFSLSALETVAKAKSLANPRVITIDKEPALISKGTAIPYATQAEGGGTTIQSQDATLSLNVTPEIQPNGIIKLDVSVTNDSPTVVPGADAPGISKQQIKTQALVKNGETLVLGGIFTNIEDESEIRVPVLSRIPIIGWLFKTRSVTKIPNELMIFITPRIVS